MKLDNAQFRLLQDNRYVKLGEEIDALKSKQGTIPDSEYYLKLEEFEEERSKLKRRMLGNIRFVGELYKKGLLQTTVMHNCVEELIGSEASGWKRSLDDEDLELLVRLVKTVGETLELKSQSREQSDKFESYFRRMHELARDKSLNSRMRFAIEEVITLRQNKWKDRRAQEGPLKISEIHQKIQAEEQMQQQFNRQPSNRQQVQIAPGLDQQQKMILSRNKHGGGMGQQNRNINTGGGGRHGDSRMGTPNAQNQGPGGDSLRRVNSDTAVAGPALDVRTLTFDDESRKKKVKTAMSDYVKDKDINMVLEIVVDPVMCGYLLLESVNRYLDAKEMNHPVLVLFRDQTVADAMRAANKVVVRSIQLCEPLKCLCDTTSDIRDVSLVALETLLCGLSFLPYVLIVALVTA